MAKFRIKAIIKNANPFLPDINAFGRQFSTWEFEAKSKEEVEMSWKDAQEQNVHELENFTLQSIEEIT